MSQKALRMIQAVGVVATIGMFVGVAGLGAVGVAFAQVPTLNETSITIGVGQSSSVTSNNGVNVYIGSNTASNVVSASVNGTQITLTGVGPGSADLSICGVGTASDCTNLYVTVQSTPVTSISFSSNNLSLSIGGAQTVTLSGGNGNYSVSSNSNTSVASTNLSGSSLTVTGDENGSVSIEVCDTSGNCGTLSATIGSGSSSSSGLSFSSNNISLAPGSNQTINISGGDLSYQITGNSNANVVSTGLANGNGLVVDALTSGSATITVCDTSNTSTCGTVAVTVTGSTTSSGSSSSNGAVSFSVPSPTTITAGQTLNVTLSGGATTYVVLSNETATVASANISGGNLLSIYGEEAGSDVLTVCAIAGNCSSYTVTVSGTAGTTTTPPVTTTTATPPTTTTAPAGTVVNSALLSEIQTLQNAVSQTLTQIQSIESQLNQLEAQVNAGSGSGISTDVGAGTSTGSAYDFTELLSVGSEDAQVTELQQHLTALGFYSGPITGYYGSLTEQSVMRYQQAHGITATGETGPETRAALNAGN